MDGDCVAQEKGIVESDLLRRDRGRRCGTDLGGWVEEVLEARETGEVLETLGPSVAAQLSLCKYTPHSIGRPSAIPTSSTTGTVRLAAPRRGDSGRDRTAHHPAHRCCGMVAHPLYRSLCRASRGESTVSVQSTPAEPRPSCNSRITRLCARPSLNQRIIRYSIASKRELRCPTLDHRYRRPLQT